jgi:radical SAM protein with 4Fe4S-binding SPASM domain
MSFKTGHKIINEANKLGARWLSFTGGEPFLELELLQKLIDLSASRVAQTEVVTNGHWATSPFEAEKTLKPLKESGLDVLNLSIDDYHSEFIPINSVKNAYYAALSLDLRPVIMTTRQKNSKLTSDSIIELIGDTNIQVLGKTRIRNPNALLIETSTTPAGRGKSIKNLDKKQVLEIKCSESLKDIGIDPNGEVYPCCGPLATKYSIGNIMKTNLEDILNEAWKDPFLSSIHKGAPIMGEYSSKCHACLSLFEQDS